MKILSTNVHPRVTHIIHLADLHIRNGDRLHSRAVEYDHVFTALYNDINKLPCVISGTALVVICGDVFHNKGKMETEGAKVLFLWLNKMLQIVPILVIAGNHDFRQEDPSYTDTIDYIVTPYNEKSYKFPIHYLKDTDHYVWENVGIGMCSVKDTLREYNTVGCVDKLPLFPIPDSFPKNIQHRVAMFHGTIIQSALPSGRSGETITTGYPLEWMTGYSIALLGDNHKQQINVGINDTLKWGYPGSLIQQDDGEPTFGHGYLLWDLSTYTATATHIHNDYGNITIIKDENEGMMVRFSSRDIIPITEAFTRISFPMYPKVRLVGFQYEGSSLPILFKKNHIQPSTIKVTNSIGTYDKSLTGCDTGLNINSGIVTMNEVNTPQQWEKYLHKQMPTLNVSEWIYDVKKILFSVERNLPTTVLDKIKDRNNTLQKLIDDYDNAIQSIETTRYNITIKSMEWAYIMCYGEDNYIDLEKLEGSIVLLNGPNASGKSSFLDVLCLGIYGNATTTRSESSDVKSGAHIIHDDKPNSASAYARVIVDIDGVLYEIKRSFGSSSHGHKNTNYVSVCKIINEAEMILIAEGNLTVDEWIRTRFGTLHDLLMTTAICQMDTTSFFAMNSASQKEVFDKSLNLNTISAYQGILEEAVRAYKQIYTLLATYIAGRKDRNFNQITGANAVDNGQLNTDLDHCKLQLYELEHSIHELTTLSNDIRMKIYLSNNTICTEANHLSYDEVDKLLNTAIYELDISKQHYADNITTEHKQELFIEQGQLYRDYNSVMKQVIDHSITDDEQKMGNTILDTTVLLDTLKVHNDRKPTEPIMSESHINEVQSMYNAWCLQNPKMLLLHDQDILMKQYEDVTKNLTSTETKLTILNNEHVLKPDCFNCIDCIGTLDLNEDDYVSLKDKVFNCKSKIKAHDIGKPLYNGRNIKQIQEIISKYETWISLQPQDWLEDITKTNNLCATLQENVATISKQCDELQPVSKPNVDRIDQDNKVVTVIPVKNYQVDKVLQQLTSKIAVVRSKVLSIVPSKPESGKSKWKAELKKWKSLCKDVVNCTSEQLRSYKNSYDDLIRNKSLLLEVESSTSEDIIDLENIPFNPHCDACNKNHKPTQEKLVAKRTLLTQTRTSIEDIDKSLRSLIDILTGLNIYIPSKRNGNGNGDREIDIALHNRDYYESNVERMMQEVNDWTAAAKDWKKLNTYHKELKSLETKYSIISWKIYDEYLTKSHDLRVKRDTLRDDLAKCATFCRDANTFIPEYNTAKAELEEYIRWNAWVQENNVLTDKLHSSEIELYKYWKAYRDYLVLKRNNLQGEVVHIDKFMTEHERWTTEINKINAEYIVLQQWKEWKNIRDRLDRDVLVATWHRNMRDIAVAMNVNEITLSKIKAIENAKETVERWTQVKYMQSLHALEKQLQEKKQIANDLHMQISELTFRIAEIGENSDIDNVYNTELLRLKADLDKVTLFRDVFVGVKGTDGMKAAIYRERVIPLIENEVNSFLNDLEEFRLTIEMNGSKLIYKVHDRGNKVLLGHCSGYQKFMIGLAMRTALSRIGAAGQSIKHLIIDEGFGCCDSNNIQRAQQIVRELMIRGQYKSIILMSHLDAIRDVSQSSINIKRDSGKFSYIQFGNPPKKYKKIKHIVNGNGNGNSDTNVQTIEPKPRGRPRKTVNKGI